MLPAEAMRCIAKDWEPSMAKPPSTVNSEELTPAVIHTLDTLGYLKFSVPEQAEVFGFKPDVGSDIDRLKSWIPCSNDAQSRAELVSKIGTALTCQLGDAHDEKERWIRMPRERFSGRSLMSLMTSGIFTELQQATDFLEKLDKGKE